MDIQYKITNKRASLVTLAGGVRLPPGTTQITKAQYDALEALDASKGPGRVYGDLRRKGVISVEVSNKAPVEAPASAPATPQKGARNAPAASLEGRSEAAAEAMIASTSDVDQLRAWEAAEKRDPVKALISRRLSSLSGR